MSSSPETGVIKASLKAKCITFSSTKTLSESQPSRSNSIISESPSTPGEGRLTRSSTEVSLSSSGGGSDSSITRNARSRNSWHNPRLIGVGTDQPDSFKFGAAIQRRAQPVGPIAQAAQSLMTARQMRQRSIQHPSLARSGRNLTKSGRLVV